MLSDNHNKQNVGTAKYRRRNEEYHPYLSKHTFKRRGGKVAKQMVEPIISNNNHNFKILRQIKNSKPTKTICKIGNQTYIFT